MRPVLVTRLQRLFNQQTTESRAVDEEVPFDGLSILQRDRFHKTGLRVQGSIFNQPFDPLDATRLGTCPQILAVLNRIEVVGVIYRWQVRPRIGIGFGKFAVLCRQGFNVKKVERTGITLFPELVPDLVKRYAINFVAIIAKWVKIAVTLLGPVDKLDSQLEGAAHCGQHVGLINTDQLVESQERRDGRLAHADDSNILGLHQRDIGQAVFGKLAKRRCRHPAGSASPYDYDIPDTQA